MAKCELRCLIRKWYSQSYTMNRREQLQLSVNAHLWGLSFIKQVNNRTRPITTWHLLFRSSEGLFVHVSALIYLIKLP